MSMIIDIIFLIVVLKGRTCVIKPHESILENNQN